MFPKPQTKVGKSVVIFLLITCITCLLICSYVCQASKPEIPPFLSFLKPWFCETLIVVALFSKEGMLK